MAGEREGSEGVFEWGWVAGEGRGEREEEEGERGVEGCVCCLGCWR